MTEKPDWQVASAQAVSSLGAITTASTEAGFAKVAEESSGATYYIIQHFHFASSPEEIPDEKYEQLRAKAEALEAELEKTDKKTHAQKCKEEFESNWKEASTKFQKGVCLTTFFACMGHGIKINSIIGNVKLGGS